MFCFRFCPFQVCTPSSSRASTPWRHVDLEVEVNTSREPKKWRKKTVKQCKKGKLNTVYTRVGQKLKICLRKCSNALCKKSWITRTFRASKQWTSHDGRKSFHASTSNANDVKPWSSRATKICTEQHHTTSLVHLDSFWFILIHFDSYWFILIHLHPSWFISILIHLD